MTEFLSSQRQSVKGNEAVEKLSSMLDKDTTLFAYGYLLDVPNLRSLLKKGRGQFEIRETHNMQEAEQWTTTYPKDIVIFRGVQLQGVVRHVVTEGQLRKMYVERKGSKAEKELVADELIPADTRSHAYLYARPAGAGERSRFLNGGLIVGLTPDELKMLDQYEYEPVYTREHVPGLAIDGIRFSSEHVKFYAGNGPLERTDAEVMEAALLAREGHTEDDPLGPAAKWPHTVQRKEIP